MIFYCLITLSFFFFFFFFFNDTATTEIYTLSLHDALPILVVLNGFRTNQCFDSMIANYGVIGKRVGPCPTRSEEHTSELQSRLHLVCRLLLEKKKTKKINNSQLNKKINIIIYNIHLLLFLA